MPIVQQQQIQNNRGLAVRLVLQLRTIVGFLVILFVLLPSSMYAIFSILSGLGRLFEFVKNLLLLFVSCTNYVAGAILAVASSLLSLLLWIIGAFFTVAGFFLSVIGEGHGLIGTAIYDTCQTTRMSLCLPVIATFYLASVAVLIFFCVHVTVQFLRLFREKCFALTGRNVPYNPVSWAQLNNIDTVLLSSDQKRSAVVKRKGRSVSPNEDTNAVGIESTNSDNDIKSSCVVCLSAPKCVVILPCRHLCVCRSCADQLRQHPDCLRRQCPLCRSHICDTISCYV